MARPGYIGLPASLLLAATLGACATGADYKGPPPLQNVDAEIRVNAIPGQTQSAAPDDWWSLLNDPILAKLESRITSENLDVKAATARLLQSRAVRRVVAADRQPSVQLDAGYQRRRANPSGAEGPPSAAKSSSFSVYDGAIDAAWEIDLWGRVDRGVEAARARQDASVESRRFVLISIQTELAREYVALRANQELLAILNDNLRIANDSVDLTGERWRNGVTTRLDLANAQAQVASIQADIPAAEEARDEAINAISLLLAMPPRALQTELGLSGPLPVPSGEAPLGLSSDLLRRRPDVRQAEAELHAATADIGAARADFYPKISLTGSVGAQALQLSNLGDWSSRQLAIGPVLSLPIFQGGRLRGILELRKAQQQEAAIHYQSTVLRAWHEVDTALTRYAAEDRRRRGLRRVVQEQETALDLAQQRYREGAIDFLNVLSVQKGLLQARSDLVQSDASMTNDFIGLYKALGGGWVGQDLGPAVVVAQSTSDRGAQP